MIAAPVALVLMVVIAAVVVALIAWLSSRSSVVLRAGGALLSGVVTIYCLIYAVALIAESRSGFRPMILVLVIMFASTAVAAVYAAFRGLRPRVRPKPTPTT
ncbi:MAG TPA: hypothetical protein VH436_08175 [Vicinamibacterales bacterium]